MPEGTALPRALPCRDCRNRNHWNPYRPPTSRQVFPLPRTKPPASTAKKSRRPRRAALISSPPGRERARSSSCDIRLYGSWIQSPQRCLSVPRPHIMPDCPPGEKGCFAFSSQLICVGKVWLNTHLRFLPRSVSGGNVSRRPGPGRYRPSSGETGSSGAGITVIADLDRGSGRGHSWDVRHVGAAPRMKSPRRRRRRPRPTAGSSPAKPS